MWYSTSTLHSLAYLILQQLDQIGTIISFSIVQMQKNKLQSSQTTSWKAASLEMGELMQTQELYSQMRNPLLPTPGHTVRSQFPHSKQKTLEFSLSSFVASDLITSFLVWNQWCSSIFPRRTRPSTPAQFLPGFAERSLGNKPKKATKQKDPRGGKKRKQTSQRDRSCFLL